MKSEVLRSKNKLLTQIVDEACAAHPEMPSKTLARQIMDKNGAVFSGLNAAICAVRYRRGKLGRRSRKWKKAGNAATVQPANPFDLPPSDEREFVPYVIDVTKTDRTLLLGDIHSPYHNMLALTAALEDGRQHECRRVILNGDTVDCYQLSHFEKDPRVRDFNGEIDITRKLLDSIRKAFPDAEIIWKDGNHDERLAKYVCEKVPEIAKAGLINWPGILNFGDRGITYVSDKRPIKLGKFHLLHGHEFMKGITVPVNPARGLYMRAKVGAGVHHHHQTSEHSESTLCEELVTCWSFGCLCDLHPAYMPINKFNHGHGMIELRETGDYKIWNRRSKGGKIY